VVPGDGDGVQRADPVPQARRQDLFQLGQRAQRRLLDAGHGAAGRGAQPHGDRDGLLVVEQQRWHDGAGAQPVTTGVPRCGVHRVAEVAQPVDVAAHGAHGDLQPLGQLRAGPVAGLLQQRQQPEQPRRGLQHAVHSAGQRGPKLSSLDARIDS
jgi:hypothetical protein